MRVIGPEAAAHLDWVRLSDALLAGHRRGRPALGDLLLTDPPLLTRAAQWPGLGAGVKSVTVRADNPPARPAVQGAMLVFAEGTGALEAVIDSALVTNWKTVADSLTGARLLAPQDPRALLVVGAGSVGRALIGAYRAVWPGLDVAIWNRTPARAAALAEETGARAVADLAAAVPEADVVAAATMATEPLIRGAWLRPGQHLDLIGAYRPDMREADDAALRRARVFVDARETTLDHIGELKDPLARGVIAAEAVRDLFDLASGAPGRTSPEDITLFKNGGGAHLDLLTARHILEVVPG